MHLRAVVGTLHSWTSFGLSHFEARVLKAIQEGDYRTNNLRANKQAEVVNNIFLKCEERMKQWKKSSKGKQCVKKYA